MYSFPETKEKHNMQLCDSVTEMCHNEVGNYCYILQNSTT